MFIEVMIFIHSGGAELLFDNIKKRDINLKGDKCWYLN